MDSERDIHNDCYDFLGQDSYDQRLNTFDDFDILEAESESGQIRGDSGGVRFQFTETSGFDLGVAEAGDNLFGEEEAMLIDEEPELEAFNLMNWYTEPVRANPFSLVPSLESIDDAQDGQLLIPYDNTNGIAEAFESIMLLDSDMESAFDNLLATLENAENVGDYIPVFGEMFDNQAGTRGRPPASKSIVDNLPDVEITSEELRNGTINCAICKDEIVIEEKVKRLPCKHYYHGDCIMPWLGIRNTCPVCRYELPTADLDYERIRNHT